MLANIGLVILFIAFLLSLFATLSSVYGGVKNKNAWVESARNASL